jgi:hypothetical protein
MATKQQQVISFIDFDTSIFAEYYQQGLRRFLFYEHEHAGPISDEDVVATFKNFTYTGLFDGQQEQSLRRAVGTCLGTICAGVLSLLTGQLRTDVTTLVAICNQNTARGYRAGREWFFVDAVPHEHRYTESRLIERLRESVLEMVHCQDSEPTWLFAIGCLLGELSGQLFPMNDQEQKVYIPQHQRLEEARQRHRDIQTYLAPLEMHIPIA